MLEHAKGDHDEQKSRANRAEHAERCKSVVLRSEQGWMESAPLRWAKVVIVYKLRGFR